VVKGTIRYIETRKKNDFLPSGSDRTLRYETDNIETGDLWNNFDFDPPLDKHMTHRAQRTPLFRLSRAG